LGWKGTYRVHLAHPLCSKKGRLQLDQVAQILVQPGLECFQGWGLRCLSGQTVPVFHHSHGKKFLPYIWSKSTFPWFKAITPCPVTTGLAKTIFPIFPISPLQVLERCSKVSLEPSLLQAEQTQLFQSFLLGEVFHPSDHFCGFLWTCSDRSMSFLC